MTLSVRGAANALRRAALLAALLLAFLHQLYAQTPPMPKVWLGEKKWPLPEMKDSLRVVTRYHFLLDVEDEKDFIIRAGARGEPLDEFLDRVLLPNGLKWRLEHESIVITIDSSRMPKTLKSVEVRHPVYHTGYYDQPIDTTTGAVSLVTNALLKLTVSSNLPDALENNVTGLLIPHGGQTPDGGALPSRPVIRGPSTINANPNVQYVIDKTLYNGNLQNINPEDIESATVEKDASSSALYGVAAGNGVIVFATKRGKTPTPQLEYSSNVTWQGRPDLHFIRPIAAADEIGFEQNAYKLGFYTGAFNAPQHPAPVPPVASLMNAVATGRLSPAEENERLARLATGDYRKDVSRYLYTNSCVVREHLSISAATPAHNYYFGFGYDHQPSTLTDANNDRYTFRANNSFIFGKKWTIDADAGFTLGVQTNGDNAGANYRSLHGGRTYPSYQRLVGRNGQALPVFTDYNPDFLRQLTELGFIDEYFRPVADIREEKNTVQTTDYLANLGFHYRPGSWADLELHYSIEYQSVQGKDVLSDSAYAMRDLQNTFAQRGVNGNFTFPVPGGGMATVNSSNLVANQVRLQLNPHPAWDSNHRLTPLAGIELRSAVNTGYSFRYYGYNESTSSVNSTMDLTTPYPSYLTGGSSTIPNPQSVFRTTDHFLSGYAEVMYVHYQRLYVSASVREDAANLFGVRTNQKAIPLWSGGLGWAVVPLIKLRASYGVSGNFSRQASAYTIASYTSAGVTTPLPNATILSPPNNQLRWEKVAQFDGGLDFALKNAFLTGTFDYYLKHSSDLMGQAPVDPTLGLIQSAGSPAYFYGNVASMNGYGFDLQLTARWFQDKSFHWSSVFLLSQSVMTVSNYFLPTTVGNAYLNPNVINPVPGRPLYSVYAFPYKGVDAANGDPIAYYDGTPSKSWDTIWANTPVSGMKYKGPSEPTWYGSLRNTIEVGKWSVTALVSFKLGYYFRRPSINYGNLLTLLMGNGDYARRWTQTGDEKKTNVPSAAYQVDIARDNIYNYGSSLVDKGDHIRLEDIRVSRELVFGHGKQRSRKLTVFADAANIGILWKANKDGIDPYYINSPRDNRRWSVGFRGTF